MQTKEEIIRRAIIDALGDRVTKERITLPGRNIVTQFFACYVKTASGDVAEVTFDVDMRPLSEDPIYGLTYARTEQGHPDDRDQACFSIEELVKAVS